MTTDMEKSFDAANAACREANNAFLKATAKAHAEYVGNWLREIKAEVKRHHRKKDTP